MAIYLCMVCKIYTYDEKKGDPGTNIEPGTPVSDFPDTWRCPVCGATRDSLRLLGESEKKYERSKIDDFTLKKIRDNALLKLAGICSVNKVCDGDPDRLCMGQKYGESIGMGGIGKGLGFTANVEALDRIKLRTRLVSKHVDPDMTTTVYGQKISIPVMATSLSGVKASMGGSISEMEFAFSVLQGSKNAGTIGWIGNTADEGEELTGVEAVKRVWHGIPVFKPQKNEGFIKEKVSDFLRNDQFAKELAFRIEESTSITDEQFTNFMKFGVIGSHLENIERNEGFKGFNQDSVSAVIAETDPRKQPGGA